MLWKGLMVYLGTFMLYCLVSFDAFCFEGESTMFTINCVACYFWCCRFFFVKSLRIFAPWLFYWMDFHLVFICGCFDPSWAGIFVLVSISHHSQCWLEATVLVFVGVCSFCCELGATGVVWRLFLFLRYCYRMMRVFEYSFSYCYTLLVYVWFNCWYIVLTEGSFCCCRWF